MEGEQILNDDLNRINQILNAIEELSFNNQYQMWARKLINLYKEIRPKTIDDIDIRKELDDKITYAKKIDIIMDFRTDCINTKEAENKLTDCEIYLRDILEKYKTKFVSSGANLL